MTYEHNIHGTNKSGPSGTPHGIAVEGLGKRFGDFWALRDVSFEVPPGSVLGLLGHNGAGKTTAIRILTTLSAPSEGRATVDGIDVVREPGRVRPRIGAAGQSATVDGLLSARANLEMVGRLYHLPRAVARARAAELLGQLDLDDAADRLVKTFSGGMRRRLDLAASIFTRPPVLFLDEPTTGLDPHSRNELWAMLRGLVAEGTTLLLTTQYLEEADRLADRIVVLDHGRMQANGTPAELKAQVGGERAVVTLPGPGDVAAATAALAGLTDGRAGVADDDASQLVVPLRHGTRLIELVRALDGAGIDAVDVQRREATLDDVFLALTSATAGAAATGAGGNGDGAVPTGGAASERDDQARTSVPDTEGATR